jgi:predicted acyltransferase
MQSSPAERSSKRPQKPQRVISVDALRGLVMFTMIFVNDLAGADNVPAWMKHFHGPNGMTFVDMVFPAFLFIVGISIPLALGSRLEKGEPIWKAWLHVLGRTIALLAIGIMMVNSDVNGGPSSSKMGWSGTLWTVLMFVSALLAFCWVSPGKPKAGEETDPFWRRLTFVLRGAGIALMVILALTYRDEKNHHILRLHPFVIRTAWYGILGVIGWGYFVASVVFLIFRNHRTALLACTALVMSLYLAGKNGMFNGSWIGAHVNIASALGSHAAISVAGVLLGSILVTPDMASHRSRIRFTLLYMLGFAAAAVLLYRPWLISKEEGTPAWCFWACVITAALWLLFYLISDVLGGRAILRPLAIAGQNVLLAYLLSEMMESVFDLVHLSDWYDRLTEPNLHHAIARSAGCAAVILALSVLINRLGFRVRI